MKTCSVCKQDKPLSDFYMDKRRQKPLSRCKPCGVINSRQYRAKNPSLEKNRYQRDRRVVRERHLLRKYGVCLSSYELMFESQEGACAICRKTQKRSFDVDHCHATGKVRGLLCSNCNRMIGHAGDRIAILQEAAAYLAKFVPEVAAAFVRAAA